LLYSQLAAVGLLNADNNKQPTETAILLLAALADDNSCNVAAIEHCKGVTALVDVLKHATDGACCHARCKSLTNLLL